MRNFKKLFAVIMAVAMLASIMVPALAADSFKYEADAKKLYDLGLFKGISETSFDPDLGTALTRETGLALMIRAMGKEDEVKAMTKEDIAAQLAKVVDKETINVNWAEPYVAYAVKNGLTDGIETSILPNIKFGADLPLSGKEFIFFMLKAMGYDKTSVPWDDVLNKAVEIGMLTPSQAVNFGTNPEIIRDDAVGIIAGSMAGTTAGGVTLAQKLVDDGVIAVDVMAAAGYISEPTATPTPTPVALAVESVTAINNKQIAVVFNIEVDSTTAQDEANYEIKDKGTAAAYTLVDGNAVLQDDKRTVIITLNGNDALTNSTKAKVTVKKAVKDAGGVAMAANYVTTDVTVYDGIIPEVVKVEAVGLKTIRLTFSEPVYDGLAGTSVDTSNFVVKNGTYTLYVNSAVADYAKKTVTLTLGTNLNDGDVVVTVNKAGADAANALRDFAGIRLFQGEVSFAYAKDTTAPTVEVKEATQTKVVLKFSKPVYGTDVKLFHSVKGVENYGVSSGTTYAGTANAAEEWTFTFGDIKKIPAGNVTLYLVNSTVDANKITDLYGNKVADATLTASIIVDVTPPTVAETKLNTNTSFDITFSEDIDPAEIKTANFTLKTASDGKDVSFSVSANGTKGVRIARTSGNFTDNTDYEVVVKAMKDLAGNALEAEYTVTFTVGDNTNPTVTDAFVVDKGAADDLIYIIFSEPMNETEMVNKANYLVDPDGDGAGAFKALDGDDKIEAVSDKQVKITFHDGVTTPHVKIFPITDLAGKRIGSADTIGYQNAKLTNIPGDSLTIEKAELTAKNKIKVTFNKELATFDPEDIDILKSNGDPFDPAIQISAVESMTTNSKGKTEVILIIDQDIGADATKGGSGVIVKTDAAGLDTSSVQGTVLSAGVEEDVVDKVAPTISKIIFVDTTRIEVQFSENLLASSIAGAGKNGFSVSGGTLTSALKGTADNVIILTGTDFGIATDVTYTAGNIVDAAVDIYNALETVSKTADLTVGAITVVANNPVDNTFEITTNFEATTLAVGDIDMDPSTTGVQDDVEINGVTYTVTVDGSGVATITASGTADDDADATTASFTIKKHGVVKTVTMNIAAIAQGDAGVDPTVAGQ